MYMVGGRVCISLDVMEKLGLHTRETCNCHKWSYKNCPKRYVRFSFDQGLLKIAAASVYRTRRVKPRWRSIHSNVRKIPDSRVVDIDLFLKRNRISRQWDSRLDFTPKIGVGACWIDLNKGTLSWAEPLKTSVGAPIDPPATRFDLRPVTLPPDVAKVVASEFKKQLWYLKNY